MLAVRIRDEDLPEVTPSDQTDDALHTLSIELVEDVIQEEKRALGVGRREQGVLGELQRDEEGLILPLAPDLANELFAEEHLQVVLVQTHFRIAHEAVTLTGLTQELEAMALVLSERRRIDEAHTILPATDSGIVLLEEGNEVSHEGRTTLVEERADLLELQVEDFEDGIIGTLALQEHIALLEDAVVLCECRHIDAILLGELLVDEAATLVAPSEDELVVLWRDDDQREGTDMIAELGILLLVALEDLAMPWADLQEQLTLVAEVASVDGIEHGSLLPVLHGEAVGDREVTLGEGEVVQRIQQVGLSHPIEANEAIDLGGEGAGG